MNEKLGLTQCADCGNEVDVALDTTGARTPCPRCGSINRRYLMRAVDAQPTNYVLDTFIAHRLSELTQCEAPELKDDSEWLNNFILSNVFGVRLQPDHRAYAFNFLRRTEAAGSAYRAAVAHVHEYLRTPRNVVSPYFRALGQLEICVAQCYQGYELLARAAAKQVYTQGDGSPEERLQIVYVDSKHMDRMIAGGKLPSEATSGLWITNDGLASARGNISFVELHALLSEMHSMADWLANLATLLAEAHE